MLLPAEFSNLEAYAREWALEDGPSRASMRRSSTKAEMREFYDAMIGQLDSIMKYLNRYGAKEMPEDARRLLCLTLSLAEVSRSIERPGTEGLDESRFELVHEPHWPNR